MQIAEAVKECRKCRELKTLDSFHVLSKARDGRQYVCKDCACARTRQWNADNKEHASASSQKYYQKNKERTLVKNKQWVLKNPERALSFGRKYRAGNTEKESERAKRYRSLHTEALKESTRRYHTENPGLKAAWDADRRAQKKSAMPPWVDRTAIAAVYREARKRTEETGIQWHVDHIVPLKNELVCGLHVAHNLQIITGTENMSKHNKFSVT